MEGNILFSLDFWPLWSKIGYWCWVRLFTLVDTRWHDWILEDILLRMKSTIILLRENDIAWRVVSYPEWMDIQGSVWNIAKVKGFCSQMFHISPYVGKAKMHLRCCNLFEKLWINSWKMKTNFWKLKNSTASQTHFGFINIGSKYALFLISSLLLLQYFSIKNFI